MKIDTWINDELVTVDTDDVWLETFAHWDAKVPTDTAAAIATATQAILERDNLTRPLAYDFAIKVF